MEVPSKPNFPYDPRIGPLMSVIINDFEIIPESPNGESDEDQEQTPSDQPQVRPIDVIDIVDRAERRRRRLRAH